LTELFHWFAVPFVLTAGWDKGCWKCCGDRIWLMKGGKVVFLAGWWDDLLVGWYFFVVPM
jgi:hypothetical protein